MQWPPTAYLKVSEEAKLAGEEGVKSVVGDEVRDVVAGSLNGCAGADCSPLTHTQGAAHICVPGQLHHISPGGRSIQGLKGHGSDFRIHSEMGRHCNVLSRGWT